jgi:TolB-like protein/Tfp pilus assembly protein PilF/tRNA A-37 threonylcarbamoyl transferase component Bud32
MIGKAISHYKVLAKLGEGGMGVVYKAEDTRLKRTVALKFLPPELICDSVAKIRFVQEAQATSALDHPNICTIYEIDETEDGQIFIAMVYYEGEPLKQKMEQGPLEMQEVIDIAVQVAQGLAKAHGQGIVHRDIKPANILITGNGLVKIVDFGLAKLTDEARIATTGTIVGTVAYMSPEQLCGEAIDQRTDIWALGVVIYEMLTGQLPFKGEYEQAVVYSILNEAPQPVTLIRTDVSTELERIVDKTLTKNLDERYQNARDILVDLRQFKKKLEWVTLEEQTSTARPQPSIAVLPFYNLSADKEQEYFCDGMAEEIINALTYIEGLRVVARTSTFVFKDKKEDIREIGKKLNVETLLEGTVRKAGNRLRITVQLVNVADGYHLWSEKYDRDIGALCCPEDIFAIQDEISLAIVSKLRLKLFGEEKARLMKRHTEDLEAHNSYLKGRFFWNKRMEEGLKKAIEYFKQAIEKDPDYALAYAGLADAYLTLPGYSSIPPKEVWEKAKEAALKALEIDNTLAEAHTALAYIKTKYDLDWEGAEREFIRAIAINPGYSTVHHWYAFLLMYRARFEEAMKEIKQAHELDPLSLVINRNMGQVLYYARQYDIALEALQKTIEMDPNFSLAHFYLGCTYLQKSMHEDALVEFQKEKSLWRELNPYLEAYIGVTYAKMAKRDKAQEVLENLMEQSKHAHIPSYGLAWICFALEENNQGFMWLEKAYEERDSWLCEIKVDPVFDSAHLDPRFKGLLKRVGLDD